MIKVIMLLLSDFHADYKNDVCYGHVTFQEYIAPLEESLRAHQQCRNFSEDYVQDSLRNASEKYKNKSLVMGY